MHRCLQLAAHGRGFVGSGALVGAVLVRDGAILAEAYYSKFGESHAERLLLQKYVQKISSNDVLFVNLEPCVPFAGKKTPPCIEIVQERGIKTVVIGMLDPDPRVSGRGVEALRQAGITVIGPVLRTECEYLNRGYISARTKQRSWITLKQARTTDGQISNPDGSPLKITSREQDVWSHTFLRAQHDAILVGVQTAINDDPSLTPRLSTVPVALQPWRIVLDPSLRTPRTAKLVTDEYRARTMLVCKIEELHSATAQYFQSLDVRVLGVPLKDDQFDLQQLWFQLIEPRGDFHGLTSVLIEAGQKTGRVFRAAGVDQEVILQGTGL